MNEIVVIEKKELIQLIKNTFRELMPVHEKKQEKQKLSMSEAVGYLNEIGFEMTKSTMYKLTADGKIPFAKYGKRNIFDRKELEKWIKEQLEENNKVTKATAQAARNKK